MGKITPERESTNLHAVKDAELNLLPWWFRFLPPFFPLKTAMAEQSLQSYPLDMSPPSPQTAIFSDLSTFPFYWHLPLELLAFEQQATKPELSSTVTVTCLTHPNPDCELHQGGLYLVAPPAQSCLKWRCKECRHAHCGAQPGHAQQLAVTLMSQPAHCACHCSLSVHFLFWPQTWDHGGASLMFNY